MPHISGKIAILSGQLTKVSKCAIIQKLPTKIDLQNKSHEVDWCTIFGSFKYNFNLISRYYLFWILIRRYNY